MVWKQRVLDAYDYSFITESKSITPSFCNLRLDLYIFHMKRLGSLVHLPPQLQISVCHSFDWPASYESKKANVKPLSFISFITVLHSLANQARITWQIYSFRHRFPALFWCSSALWKETEHKKIHLFPSLWLFRHIKDYIKNELWVTTVCNPGYVIEFCSRSFPSSVSVSFLLVSEATVAFRKKKKKRFLHLLNSYL